MGYVLFFPSFLRVFLARIMRIGVSNSFLIRTDRRDFFSHLDQSVIRARMDWTVRRDVASTVVGEPTCVTTRLDGALWPVTGAIRETSATQVRADSG